MQGLCQYCTAQRTEESCTLIASHAPTTNTLGFFQHTHTLSHSSTLGTRSQLCLHSFHRPLYYYWPEAEEAYTYTNCYLFGDSLLCSPIASAVEPASGIAATEVWFPPGVWRCWFTGKRCVSFHFSPRQIDGATESCLQRPCVTACVCHCARVAAVVSLWVLWVLYAGTLVLLCCLWLLTWTPFLCSPRRVQSSHWSPGVSTADSLWQSPSRSQCSPVLRATSTCTMMTRTRWRTSEVRGVLSWVCVLGNCGGALDCWAIVGGWGGCNVVLCWCEGMLNKRRDKGEGGQTTHMGPLNEDSTLVNTGTL